MIVRRFQQQAKSPLVSTENCSVYNDDALKVSLIMSGTEMLCGVWESDAQLHNIPRQELAERWLGLIRDVIDQYRKNRAADAYLKGIVFALIAPLIFLMIWIAGRMLCHKEIKSVEPKFSWRQILKLLDGDSLVPVNGNIVRFVR